MLPRISPRTHACLDVLSWCSFAAAPFYFTPGTPARAGVVSHLFGLAGFLISICTRYPAGLFPLISFRTHGRLELASVPVLTLAPWLAGFAGWTVARDYFVASGLALLLLWIFTDYDAPKRERARSPR